MSNRRNLQEMDCTYQAVDQSVKYIKWGQEKLGCR